MTEELDCSAESQCSSTSGGTLISRMRDVGSKRIVAGVGIDGTAPAPGRQDAAREVGQREGVGQQADAGTAPHARQRKLRGSAGVGRSSQAMPSGSSQRAVPDGVSVSISTSAILGLGYAVQQRDPDGVRALVLLREPAALGEIGRQNLAFEHRARGQQAFERSSWRMTMVWYSGMGSGAGVCSDGHAVSSARLNQ